MRTLMIYNSEKSPDLSAKVLNYVYERMHFDEVLHLASSEPTIKCCGKFIKVKTTDYAGAMKFQVEEVPKYFKTDHLFFVETDGFPVNFNLWDKKFLDFDYIGAPWTPWNTIGNRIGNQGCSITTPRFWESVSQKKFNGKPSDQFICQDIEQHHKTNGITFADLHTAMRFSFEAVIPEFPSWDWTMSFAFHGKQNTEPLNLLK